MASRAQSYERYQIHVGMHADCDRDCYDYNYECSQISMHQDALSPPSPDVQPPPPPPQIGGPIRPTSPICSADLWDFCDLADSFCRLVGASGTLGHLVWRCHSKMCSFTLGHSIIPLVVQIGTMKCFYCPQKDASVVPWDSLSPDDPIFLRDKYPDAGRGHFVTCVFALHAPVRSSALLQAPHHQPPNQWILGCRCLRDL